MSSGLRKLADPWSFIQMTSSMYGKKAGTYLLFLSQTYLRQLPYHSGSIVPLQSSAGLTPLWPESYLN